MSLHPAIGFAKGAVFEAGGVHILVVSGPYVEGGDSEKVPCQARLGF
jgi:hypothetical protein